MTPTPVMKESLAVAMRPRKLSSMFGMDTAIATLRKQMTTRAPRTILLSGVPGCGKTSMARIIAVAAQCDHSQVWGDPCDACRARVISWSPLQSDFAIHEINAAEHSGVEELEAICRLSYSRPMTGLKRVIILDEVHSLSAAAWKTTLKPMEEPPAHMLWILCTSDVRKVPAANQRRAAKYAMRELGVTDTERFLARYAKVSGVTREIKSLIEACHTMQVGSPGVLLQALDKYAAGASPKDAVAGADGSSVDSLRICKAVTSGQWPAVAKMLKEMADGGTLAEDTRWLQMSLAGWLRGCMVRGTGADAERAALSLIELSTPPFDETMRANWLCGVIFKVTARYGRR
jgi:DNA polymerase III delta prime subunit